MRNINIQEIRLLRKQAKIVLEKHYIKTYVYKILNGSRSANFKALVDLELEYNITPFKLQMIVEYYSRKRAKKRAIK